MSPRPARTVLSYLRAVDSRARRRILFPGTSPDLGRRVLSEGLVPDPKKRSWAEDPDVSFTTTPRTSFSGVYLTGNLMTAYSSATRTAGPHAEHIIVIVDVEEATLVHDEDSLRGPLEMALDRLVGSNLTLILSERAVLELYDAMVRGKLDNQLRDAAEFFLKSYDTSAQKGYGLSRAAVVEPALRALVTRQASYALPRISWFAKEKTWEEMGEENARSNQWELKDLPAPEEADKVYMDTVERLSNLLKPMHASGFVADRFMDLSRLRTPVGFSGANKIVAVVGISRVRGDSDKPYVIKFKYGNPQDPRLHAFYKQFEQGFTKNFVVLDKNGNTVDGSLNSALSKAG